MKLIMELKSDALPGSGEGLTGIIDTDINYDEYGVPYIPGKRIKGILKESAEELTDAEISIGEKILNTPVEKIFGEPGMEKGTKLKISDGQLEKAALLKKLLHFTDKIGELGHIFNKETVLDLFTYLRSQTTIDGNYGVAKENSLRTFRVLAKGTRFYFDVELPDEYREDFEKICKVTRHFGISRTRGLGEIKLSLNTGQSPNNHEKEEFINTANQQLSDETVCRMVLSIKNTGQLLVTKQVGKTQWSEKYIPGDVILGTLAGVYIESRGIKTPHENKNFRDIFLKGKVIFSNGYPESKNGNIYYPAPLSVVKRKDRENFYDLTRDRDCKDIKENEIETKGGAGEFAFIDDGYLQTIDVKTEMGYHHSRPADKSIGHAREKEGEKEGEFFQFLVIQAGQSFQSEITGKIKYLKPIEDMLKQRPVFYLGKSGTAQYGKCRIKIKNIAPVKNRGSSWGKDETMVLTLAADMILLNKYGFMSTDPELLLEEIAGELGVDHRKLEIEKKFLTFNRVSGFLSVWKMPKIQQTALKAGSVLVTRNNSGSDLPLENIMDHRFGINTEQGYGQVKINLHGKSGSEITVESYQDKTPVSLQKGELLPLGDFIRAILIKRLKILLKAESVEQARETGKIPTSAFLGKMLTFIEQSRSFQELYELVNRLKERGRKQLALLEKGLIIKSGKIDKKRIETFITPVYNHILENPDSKNILLQSADIEEHFFKEEKYLFDLYQTYAGFFLNQLKLKKRRENE